MAIPLLKSKKELANPDHDPNPKLTFYRAPPNLLAGYKGPRFATSGEERRGRKGREGDGRGELKGERVIGEKKMVGEGWEGTGKTCLRRLSLNYAAFAKAGRCASEVTLHLIKSVSQFSYA